MHAVRIHDFAARHAVSLHQSIREATRMKTILRTMVAAMAAWPLLASLAFAGGAVTVKGSDTMVILGQRWAETYMKKNPGAKIQVTGGGSGTGIAALINGTTDIAESSRADEGRGDDAAPSRSSGAKVDGDRRSRSTALAIYVQRRESAHRAHACRSCARSTPARSRTGRRSAARTRRSSLYGRENNSGTYVFFKEHVLQNEDFAAGAQTLPGTAAVVNAVVEGPERHRLRRHRLRRGRQARSRSRRTTSRPRVEADRWRTCRAASTASRASSTSTFPAKSPAARSRRSSTGCCRPTGQKVVTDGRLLPGARSEHRSSNRIGAIASMRRADRARPRGRALAARRADAPRRRAAALAAADRGVGSRSPRGGDRSRSS